jgi:D-sedoheptulose 7-phosphate isomerase
MVSMSKSYAVTPSAEFARGRLAEAISVKQRMVDGIFAEQATEIAWLIIRCLQNGGKIIFFGNGGSAQDAGHLAAELTGRFAFDRPGLSALSLPDATAAMTAIGNDYGYDEVFARQVLAVGRPGDVAIGLTTSGNSPNVVRALDAARSTGMTTVVLTGANGGKVAAIGHIAVRVPTDDTARAQEACLHLGHTICEMVEAAMFHRQW